MKKRKEQTPKALVELTRRALADLREIERHVVSEGGRKTADKVLEDFATALDRLRENPEILPLEADFAPCLYFYQVKKYVLACDYHGDNKIIVLAVAHTVMDLPTRLQKLEPRLIVESQMVQAKLRQMAAKG